MISVLLLSWMPLSSSTTWKHPSFLRARTPSQSTQPALLLLPVLDLRGGGSGENSTHNASTSETAATTTAQHEIVHESVLFSTPWRSFLNRTVRLPYSGKLVDFFVGVQAGSDRAVLVFGWNSTDRTATLIREYMPASNRLQVGCAAGMVEHDKHNNSNNDQQQEDVRQTAARYELEEECRLVGGTAWYELARDVVMDKYSTTALTVYLVVDPERIPAHEAKPRDETEEGMEILSGVSVPQVLEWIRTGEMTIVGSWTCLLALEKLRELGEIH